MGGTTESRELVQGFQERGIPCVVTVTTPEAQGLYSVSPPIHLWVGKLTLESLPQFLQAWDIRAMVDGAHPFATTLREMVTAIAQVRGLPYLRFERAALPLGNNSQEIDTINSLYQEPYFSQLAQKRVFLTLGAKFLPLFKPLQPQTTLFTRILPHLSSLHQAIAAGFTPDRIIALRPPISEALEQALWEQWAIDLVITKASGPAGGEDRKQRLADRLGIPLWRIARPPLPWGESTGQVQRVYEFCAAHLKLYPWG